MKNDLKTAIDTRLAGLDWQGQAAVLERIRAPRHRTVKLRSLMIACTLLLFTCATALALTLQFSYQYNVVRQARSAVSAKYGLTDEMLDLFAAQTEQTAEGWQVRFKPLNLDTQAMGIYTVLCRPDGSADAFWSHDGEEDGGLPAGDLGCAAWGAEQLARIITLRRASAQAWSDAALGNYEEMTLEERAALDAPLLESPESSYIINIAPQALDLTPQAAETLAREAAAQKYGLSLEDLEDYAAEISFLLIGPEEAREYRVSLMLHQTRETAYQVALLSPSGKITSCKWWVAPENRALPQGDLSQYVEAAKEYADSGAFELLPAREKARVAQRFEAAGLRVLLPAGDYLAPAAGDIIEAEALQTAQEALHATYGFSPACFDFFTRRTSLLREADNRCWQITFLPKEQPNWHWRDFDKLGTYTVTLSAADGKLVSAQWSFDDTPGLDAYTPETFGIAPAYSAPMLPWLKALLDRLDDILKRYPDHANLDDFSLEDQAAYDDLMRQAGYDPRYYTAVLPQAGELTQQEAVAQAIQALTATYGLEAERLSACETCVSCYMDYELGETPVKVWGVTFAGYDMDQYTVILTAATGEIGGIWHDTPASANG